MYLKRIIIWQRYYVFSYSYEYTYTIRNSYEYLCEGDFKVATTTDFRTVNLHALFSVQVSIFLSIKKKKNITALYNRTIIILKICFTLLSQTCMFTLPTYSFIPFADINSFLVFEDYSFLSQCLSQWIPFVVRQSSVYPSMRSVGLYLITKFMKTLWDL